jgi:hypothetical protein
MLDCQQFDDLLAQQPDGPLPLVAHDHLQACPRCRLLQEELQTITIAARDWGRQEPAPPLHLWAAIQTQLQAEGLIVEPSSPGWFHGWFDSMPRLTLAGAYLSLLLMATGLVTYRTGPISSPPTRPGAASAPSLAGLGQTLHGNMERVVASFSEDEGSVAVSLRQNLGIVDNLIKVCEKSVREHPGDPLAREYLYGAYQQKADLLVVAMDRSALENK